LNKVDKPNANPDKVKHQLSEVGLVPDDFGGDTLVVPVSAKKRTGVDDLLEAVVLTADNTKILTNPAGKLIGSVIEAQLDKAKGPIASLLIQNGTLRIGDTLVAGQAHGKIRAMYDSTARRSNRPDPPRRYRSSGCRTCHWQATLLKCFRVNGKRAR
jgi:translation initiation factor IF-2